MGRLLLAARSCCLCPSCSKRTPLRRGVILQKDRRYENFLAFWNHHKTQMPRWLNCQTCCLPQMPCRQNDPRESFPSSHRSVLWKALCFQPQHPLFGAKSVSFILAAERSAPGADGRTHHGSSLLGSLWAWGWVKWPAPAPPPPNWPGKPGALGLGSSQVQLVGAWRGHRCTQAPQR